MRTMIRCSKGRRDFVRSRSAKLDECVSRLCSREAVVSKISLTGDREPLDIKVLHRGTPCNNAKVTLPGMPPHEVCA